MDGRVGVPEEARRRSRLVHHKVSTGVGCLLIVTCLERGFRVSGKGGPFGVRFVASGNNAHFTRVFFSIGSVVRPLLLTRAAAQIPLLLRCPRNCTPTPPFPSLEISACRLGLPGRIRGVEVDTAFFTGNQAPRCSLQGAWIPEEPVSAGGRRNAVAAPRVAGPFAAAGHESGRNARTGFGW